MAVVFFLITAIILSEASAATVSTDRHGYLSGETVIIAGSFRLSGEAVLMLFA